MSTYVAIDLGGTNIRVALVDEKVNILKALREKSIHGDNDALYQQIHRMIKSIISMNDEKDEVKFCGISAAGFLRNGILEYSPNLQIKHFELLSELSKDFPSMKFAIANDANASALNEHLNGAAKGCKTSFFMTISSGIGCGLVYDNKLVDLPFEGGHNYVGYRGRFYELEQVCSGNGLVNLAKINNYDVSDAGSLFASVARGDEKARVVYEDWLKLLGSYIANVQLLYEPEAIVLSGGVMRSKAIFINDLLSVANAFVAPFPVNKIHFVDAAFAQDTGLGGGAALAIALEKAAK